ncbi:MAG: STE24 endopeptidase [Candidatus Azotimanducaceae bacterium]
MSSATLDEVKAVTAHAVRHYVLGHVWCSVRFYSLLAIIFSISARIHLDSSRAYLGCKAPLESAVGLPVFMFFPLCSIFWESQLLIV